MKSSVKKDIHNGTQPIRVLKHNLTTRLVERNDDYIKTLQSTFRLNRQIKYNISDRALTDGQCPFIDKNGMINIHETYLSYIWIISYYFFVLHEECIVIPGQIKRGLPTRKSVNTALVTEADELFNYAKSLIVVYSDWDKENFPNPEFFDENTEQGWYILRTNDIFVEALNFILYHETAHAEFEHIKRKNRENLSDDDIKGLELEADSRAIELILSSKRNQNSSELAVTIGLASMLFFKNRLYGGKNHPDIDVRLQNALDKFKPTNDNPIWAMLAIFLKVWNEQFNLGIKEKDFYNDYREVYYDLLSQIK